MSNEVDILSSTTSSGTVLECPSLFRNLCQNGGTCQYGNNFLSLVKQIPFFNSLSFKLVELRLIFVAVLKSLLVHSVTYITDSYIH